MISQLYTAGVILVPFVGLLLGWVWLGERDGRPRLVIYRGRVHRRITLERLGLIDETQP